jgi:hypothetical protein
VFLFGGSTTFGYGLPDDQTIASHLQRALAREAGGAYVYNFGRGHYFSTQERILFESQLLAGVRPDVAIFIDGLNDFSHPDGLPHFTESLTRLVDQPASLSRTLGALPAARLLESVRIASRRRALRARELDDAVLDAVAPGDLVLAGDVIERYRANQRLIESAASSFGVEVWFVWQPIPTYEYALEHHLFRRDISARHQLGRVGYGAMRERLEHGEMGERFIWLADMQEDRREPLYVDAVHYDADMSEAVAEAIAAKLAPKTLTTPY